VPITVGQPIEINGIVYDVQKVLGKGGFSIVYSAYEQILMRKVAIKEYLYPKFYDPYTHENECEIYFDNEVLNTQAQARSGKKCVEILNYAKKLDLQTPEFYIVLNFIDGQTFLEFYREFITTCRGLEHLDLASMVRYVFLPLAELLQYCHEQEGIIHRDFAVSNIIIQRDKESYWPVLIDWGVSKYVGNEWIHHTPKPYMTEEMQKDIPINQKGAPPEVKMGFMPNATSDIYYLGHLMYFTFTGGIVREDSENINPDEFVLNPKKMNVFIPDAYNEFVMQLTQFEPADRIASMEIVIRKLKNLITISDVHFDFDIFGDPDTDNRYSAS